MIYIFRCKQPLCMYGEFEVEQCMMEKHVAECPICYNEAQRVYSVLPFQFGKADYNKDGSRDLNPDLPHVPTGTRYTHGWNKDKGE